MAAEERKKTKPARFPLPVNTRKRARFRRRLVFLKGNGSLLGSLLKSAVGAYKPKK